MRTALLLALGLQACSIGTFNVKENETTVPCRLYPDTDIPLRMSTGPNGTLDTSLEFTDGSGTRISFGHSVLTNSKNNVHVGLQNTRIRLDDTGFRGFSVSGFSIDDTIGAGMVQVTTQGISFVPEFVAPIAAVLRLPHIASDPKGGLRALFLHDVVPVYQIDAALQSVLRGAGVDTSIQSDDPGAAIHRVHQEPSIPGQLRTLEAAMRKFPLYKGILEHMHNTALLNESFLFVQHDVQDGRNVHDKIITSLEDSLEALESTKSDVIFGFPSNDGTQIDSYISSLYLLSQLVNVHIKERSMPGEACHIEFSGPYLFVTNREERDRLLLGLEQQLTLYQEKGFDQVTKELTKRYETLVTLTGDTASFKKTYELFITAFQYVDAIAQNTTSQKLSYVGAVLESKGNGTLATRFRRLSSTSRATLYNTFDGPNLNAQLEDLKPTLDAMYALVKAKDFVYEHECDIGDIAVDAMHGNLIEIVSEYVSFRDRTLVLTELVNKRVLKSKDTLNTQQRVANQFSKLVTSHYNQNKRMYGSFARKARKDYAHAINEFWSALPEVQTRHDSKINQLDKAGRGGLEEMQQVLDHIENYEVVDLEILDALESAATLANQSTQYLRFLNEIGHSQAPPSTCSYDGLY